MYAKSDTHIRYSLKFTAVVLVTLVIVAGIGCKKDDGVGPDPGLDVERTKLIDDGRLPVWVDGSRFLYSLAMVTGDNGLYLGQLTGGSTSLYGEVHNHDYTVSPSGRYAAFSTPDLNGGVYIADLMADPPQVTMVLANGKNPSWFSEELLLVENQLGEFGFVSLSDPGTFQLRGDGSFPRGVGNQQLLSFYRQPTGDGGLQLYYMDLSNNQVINLAAQLGSDAVWHPDQPRIYVSQLVNNRLTDIIEISVNSQSVTTPLEGATRPSISRDGVHMFADRLSSGQRDGIYYYNLESDRLEYIANAARPSAAPSGTRALVEQPDGIYLIEFE